MKKVKKMHAVTIVVLAVLSLGLAYQFGYNRALRSGVNANEVFFMVDSAVPLTAVVANTPTVLVNEASGRNVNANARAEVDFSNASDGYVMARWIGATTADVRVVIVGPNNVQYQYRLNTAGQWEAFPLSGGNGNYIVRVMERVEGTRFAVTNTVNISLTLTDELAPFLRPNQFVNFNANSTAVAHANNLVRESRSVLQSVTLVYNWVVENISYDTELANTVQSGYVPDLEHVMNVRRGICFDYAALMTAMLRSQGIPTRLVIGYVGTVRHAWISVFTEETGWINNLIQFDGNEWHLMDPTFTSTGGAEAARRFVGDGQNHNQTHVH